MGQYIAAGRTLTEIDGRLLRVDPIFCEMLRMREGELIGRNIIDITHAEDRGDTHFDMRRLRDEGRNFCISKRYIRSDGHVVWAEAHASVIAVEGQKLISGLIEPTPPNRTIELRRSRDVAIFDALGRLGDVYSQF